MNKLYLPFLTLLCAFFLIAGNTQAASYQFYDIDETGTGVGEANMLFSASDNVLIVELDNISSVNLIDGSDGGNSPGITGFGFNLDPDELVLDEWSLYAYKSTIGQDGQLTFGHRIQIGGTNFNGIWRMSNFYQGIRLEYIPNVQNINGALFNPLSLLDYNNTLPGGTNINFFTNAILTMSFNIPPSLNDTNFGRPFVRMQNVGSRGEGSLRLSGTPVPEPSAVIFLGLGLLVFTGYSRKFRKN